MAVYTDITWPQDIFKGYADYTCVCFLLTVEIKERGTYWIILLLGDSLGTGGGKIKYVNPDVLTEEGLRKSKMPSAVTRLIMHSSGRQRSDFVSCKPKVVWCRSLWRTAVVIQNSIRLNSKVMFQYTLHDHILEKVPSAKYLGIAISNLMSWDKHIDQTSSKATVSLDSFVENQNKESSTNGESLQYYCQMHSCVLFNGVRSLCR